MLINTLENHFKTMIEAMPLKEQRRVRKFKKNSKEFKDLSKYFRSLLKQERISLDDIAKFKEQYRMEDKFINFSPKSLAMECAKLFRYYIKKVVLPDKKEGLFIGSVYLAGTQYVSDITEIYKKLYIGELVQIVREKDNPYDKKAVKVLTQDGKMIGYIPARHNLFISQMLDFGSSLKAEVRKLKWDKSGIAIKIMIYTEKA